MLLKSGINFEKNTNMKIIIVGATGTIGKRVSDALEAGNKHEIIKVGNKSGDFRVDIGDKESITNLFRQTGNFDALINVTGNAYLGKLETLTSADFQVGLQHKLMGQIHLVLEGLKLVNPGGSFTLTSGILAEDPILNGTACSVTDAAVNGFVLSAAAELKNDVRLNVVAPGVVADSENLHDFFPGHIPVAMERVTAAYLKSLFGVQSGTILRVY